MEYDGIALIAVLFFSGIFAGLLNGLIGCGGGIVIVYVLSYLYRENEKIENRDIFAAAVASVLPITGVSATNYYLGGAEIYAGMSDYIIPAVTGGIVGAYLLGKISHKWLKRIFALLVMWAGASLVLKETGVL